MNQPIKINSQQTEQIIQQLWLNRGHEQEPIVYVILDGARNKKIHPMLRESNARFSCLYDGKLNYELTVAAPYIVRLEQNADFTHELIQQAWGNSWGIFAITHKPATLIGVRRNCKKIAFVRDEETQKKMLFRYYDPRVLREFLPTFTGESLQQLFGPITAYAMESNDATQLIHFNLKLPELTLQTTKLQRILTEKNDEKQNKTEHDVSLQ